MTNLKKACLLGWAGTCVASGACVVLASMVRGQDGAIETANKKLDELRTKRNELKTQVWTLKDKLDDKKIASHEYRSKHRDVLVHHGRPIKDLERK